MPQIGWLEILAVIIIAILVLGPKEFPIALKKIGSYIGKLKSLFSNLFFSVMGNWVISIGLLALLYKVITLPISLWESKLRRITTYRSNVLKSEKRLISKNSSGEKAHNLLLLNHNFLLV